MRITSLTVEPWTLPLLAPFQIAQRTATSANNVKVELVTEQTTGLGACAPVFYVTGESVDSVVSAISGAAPTFVGLDGSDLPSLLAAAKASCGTQPAALAGLELAIYDLWAKLNGTDMKKHFGGSIGSVVTDMTIPIVDAETAERSARDLAARGFDTLKVKVGDPNGLQADLDRIDAVRRASPKARLRIDANQGFTPLGAIDFINRVAASDAPIDFIEQPVVKTDFVGLKTVREQSPYPVFADEACCTPEHARALIDMNAVDGIVVKLMKSGLSGAIEILQICRDSGIKTMMGCMLESGIGIAAALAIGIGYDADLFDLDSHQLLAPVQGLSVPFACRDNLLVWQDGFHGWGTITG